MINRVEQSPFRKRIFSSQSEHTQALNLRNKWSRNLLILMILQLLIVDGVVIAHGLNWLQFSQNSHIIEIFVSGTFVQIIGLVVFVVKYLFSKKT